MAQGQRQVQTGGGERAARIASLPIPSYYHHRDERSVPGCFESLVGSVSVPVYVYNNPKTSGFAIGPQFLRRAVWSNVAAQLEPEV